MKQQYNLECEPKANGQLYIINKPYKCPCCGDIHKSNNLIYN